MRTVTVLRPRSRKPRIASPCQLRRDDYDSLTTIDDNTYHAITLERVDDMYRSSVFCSDTYHFSRVRCIVLSILLPLLASTNCKSFVSSDQHRIYHHTLRISTNTSIFHDFSISPSTGVISRPLCRDQRTAAEGRLSSEHRGKDDIAEERRRCMSLTEYLSLIIRVLFLAQSCDP